MEPAWFVAGASWLSLIVVVGLNLWRGGKNSAADLSKLESRLIQTISEAGRNMEDRLDQTAKMFGESLAAVRQQIALNEKESIAEMHQLSDQVRKVEIWARDEFVRKESFREVCTRIENSVAEQGRNVNAALQSVRDALMTAVTGGKLKRDARDDLSKA